MKTNIYFKISLGIVAFLLLLIIITKFIAEPLIGKKIQAAINNANKEYIVDIDKVNISFFTSTIKLKNITINSIQHDKKLDLIGEISLIQLKGIKLFKFLFKKDISINALDISNITINGKIPFQGSKKNPLVSSLNIRIDHIHIDKINLVIANTTNAQSVSINDSELNVYDFQVYKSDTLTPGILQHFDFGAKDIILVSADSMYTFTASGILNSTISKKLSIDQFSVHPNYKDYDFTSRLEYTTDCIDASFSKISLHNFSLAAYLKNKSLLSSYLEIKKLNLTAFRDNRRKDNHEIKPAFQELIYNYPSDITIDSIGVLNADITYIEHAIGGKEPGKIHFNKINAKIYNITNDTIYKSKKDYLVLKGEALLMGKSKMTLLLKAKIRDPQNSFTLNGTLSGMEVNDLYSMLKNNAFIYATTSIIDTVSYQFTANNKEANGKMILLYHGLDIKIKNKRTEGTSALKEQFMSFIVNIKAMDSNPLPGKEVRTGYINYKRDPERFLFNYCLKSILSGVKSSFSKNPKKEKKS